MPLDASGLQGWTAGNQTRRGSDPQESRDLASLTTSGQRRETCSASFYFLLHLTFRQFLQPPFFFFLFFSFFGLLLSSALFLRFGAMIVPDQLNCSMSVSRRNGGDISSHWQRLRGDTHAHCRSSELSPVCTASRMLSAEGWYPPQFITVDQYSVRIRKR
jgi:hypothetical protein